MIKEFDIYKAQLVDIINSGTAQLSDIKPSEWAEEYVVMQKPFPGPFRYDRTPYTREIVDCLAQDHPARWVAVMKGAQVGFSSGVIMPGIGWLIKNAPGNAFVTVGAPDLIEKAMEKLDLMIDSAGLRNYIKPNVTRNRANKSGDTNFKKEFEGGYVTIASANNHKAIRQIDLQYGFFDDFESIKSASKESGSTRKLLEQRFAAYADTHKIFYISTPELKASSNIEPAYELGDQRKYMIPCPCCGLFIELKWAIEKDGITGGITWKMDEEGKLIKESVGYTCQECGGFFDDKNKHELLNNGFWQPTTEPSEPGYYSYHLSSLYAPLGMYDWYRYVNNFLEANPVGQPRNEDLYKTFVNVCLGETYEETAEAPKANAIQKNVRDYDIGTIPDSLSVKDGNGKIIMITCAADMNGVVEDARLDYEIVAWSENGASYSVKHGSIGTFIPRENQLKHKADREKWTYEAGKEKSVWTAFDAILAHQYPVDNGGTMPIFMSALDCGHYSTDYAFPYLDRTNNNIIGIKGNKEGKYDHILVNKSPFKPSAERPTQLFILQVGMIKDQLASFMRLRWDENEDSQPANFMNFPQSADGLYQFGNFFEHYESEHRIVDTKKTDSGSVMARWMKKTSTAQNHMFDCRIYNMAVRDIFVWKFARENKLKDFGWKEYAALFAET